MACLNQEVPLILPTPSCLLCPVFSQPRCLVAIRVSVPMSLSKVGRGDAGIVLQHTGRPRGAPSNSAPQPPADGGAERNGVDPKRYDFPLLLHYDMEVL
jgi:hypothetical protein